MKNKFNKTKILAVVHKNKCLIFYCLRQNVTSLVLYVSSPFFNRLSAFTLHLRTSYDDWFDSFLTIFSLCSVVFESEPWSPVFPLRFDWDSRRTRSEPFRSSIVCCAVKKYFTWDYLLLGFVVKYELPYPCSRHADILIHAATRYKSRKEFEKRGRKTHKFKK